MNVTATLLASLLVVTGQASSEETPPARLRNFVVTAVYDVRVPAREEGALVAVDARKGQVVTKGQILGRVDDSDALVRKAIAENELKVAETQAASDAELQAAIATIGVAKAEWEGSVRTRAMADNAISEYQVRRDKLTFDRSQYMAETAEVEHEVNQLTRSVRLSQLQSVNNEIGRRQIESPIDGVVIERFHNVGEWAQPGEPIYRVVHMDRLRVEGMLDARELTPEEIAAHPEITFYVKVPRTAENPRGEVELRATVDFISQVVDHSGEFLISAEFDNPRKERGSSIQWAVRPGLDAEAVLAPELMRRMVQRRQQRGADSPRSAWDSLRARSSAGRN